MTCKQILSCAQQREQSPKTTIPVITQLIQLSYDDKFISSESVISDSPQGRTPSNWPLYQLFLGGPTPEARLSLSRLTLNHILGLWNGEMVQRRIALSRDTGMMEDYNLTRWKAPTISARATASIRGLYRNSVSDYHGKFRYTISDYRGLQTNGHVTTSGAIHASISHTYPGRLHPTPYRVIDISRRVSPSDFTRVHHTECIHVARY